MCYEILFVTWGNMVLLECKQDLQSSGDMLSRLNSSVVDEYGIPDNAEAKTGATSSACTSFIYPIKPLKDAGQMFG